MLQTQEEEEFTEEISLEDEAPPNQSAPAPPPPPAVAFTDPLAASLPPAEQLPAARSFEKRSSSSATSEPSPHDPLSFVPIISGLREYAEALDAGGAPRPHALSRHPATGQYIADVFPAGLEALLFGGFRGEVWLLPGAEPSQGQLYRENAAAGGGAARKGSLALVLGAGNQTPVVALDVLHVLLTQGHVVVCKMNPVRTLESSNSPCVAQSY